MNYSDFFNISRLEESYGPRRAGLFVVVPLTIVFVVIFFTGLIGNISTCIVISKNKSMHTATNFYLFSLAISDLLLLVSGLPPEIYSNWSRYPYVFGETFCILRGLFAETSANATVLTITAFTIERYVAICHPFLSHTMSNLSRVKKLIVLIWCLAVCLAVPQALQFGIFPMTDPPVDDLIMCGVVKPMRYSFELSTFLFFALPMTLITVLYALIGCRLKSSSVVKRDGGNDIGTETYPKLSNRHQQANSSRRVLKMLVAVVVAFFICWAPFHAQRLVFIYLSDNIETNDNYLKIYEVVTYISGILYFVSTTINPLLYNIMSKKFREAFKETFSKWCCGLSNGGQKRTYSMLSRSAQRAAESSDSYKDDPCLHTQTTIMHKHSVDSINANNPNSTKRLSIKNSNETLEAKRSSRPEIRITMVSKSNLDNITPNTRLVAVKVAEPPPNKLNQVLHFFKCLRASNSGRSSISSCNSIHNKDTGNSGVNSVSCNFDENKVKLEHVAVEDELTAYMQEIKLRQASESFFNNPKTNKSRIVT